MRQVWGPSVVLLTDQHFGVRSQSPLFLQHCIDFHVHVLFPFLEKHKPDYLICLGDLVDHRKMITWKVHNAVQKYFVEPLIKTGIKTYMIPGNHDCYFKNTVELNALSELIPEGQNIEVINHAEYRYLESIGTVLFLPWICAENYEHSMEMIEKNEDPIMAHLELIGFEQYRGLPAKHGMDPSIFKKSKRVFSGHYHHPSEKGNIRYLSAPYQMNWNDADCERGFHVWYPMHPDKNQRLKFIPNPNDVFVKLHYDDSDPKHKLEVTENLQNKIIKIVVDHRDNKKKFDQLINKIEKTGVADLQIIEPESHEVDTKVEADEVNKTTLQIILDSVEEFDDSTDKKGLSVLMQELYEEAVKLDA